MKWKIIKCITLCHLKCLSINELGTLLWIYQKVEMIEIQLKLISKKLNIHTNKTCLENNPFKFAILQTGCMLGMENLRVDGT